MRLPMACVMGWVFAPLPGLENPSNSKSPLYTASP